MHCANHQQIATLHCVTVIARNAAITMTVTIRIPSLRGTQQSHLVCTAYHQQIAALHCVPVIARNEAISSRMHCLPSTDCRAPLRFCHCEERGNHNDRHDQDSVIARNEAISSRMHCANHQQIATLHCVPVIARNAAISSRMHCANHQQIATLHCVPLAMTWQSTPLNYGDFLRAQTIQFINHSINFLF
jgi:hypothetical protein